MAIVCVPQSRGRRIFGLCDAPKNRRRNGLRVMIVTWDAGAGGLERLAELEGMGEQDRPGTGWQGPPLQETRKPPAVDK